LNRVELGAARQNAAGFSFAGQIQFSLPCHGKIFKRNARERGELATLIHRSSFEPGIECALENLSLVKYERRVRKKNEAKPAGRRLELRALHQFFEVRSRFLCAHDVEEQCGGETSAKKILHLRGKILS